MSQTSARRSGAEAELRRRIAAGLRCRREEIERSIATRVYAISEPPELADPAYLEGLRASFSAALDFAIAVAELGESRAPQIPTVLLAQAKMAARNGVGLETVLRRYAAGHMIVADFVFAEAERAGSVPGVSLRRLLCDQAAVFDRLIEAVSEEHRRERAHSPQSPKARLIERVRRLLSGELVDAEVAGYELSGAHLGAVGEGEVEPALRAVSAELELRFLCVKAEEGASWAWLGSGNRALDPNLVATPATELLPPGATLALGSPAEGPHGWRLTHRQALAALPMASREEGQVVHYAEVGLLAAIAKDDLLRESLQRTYLEPLAEEPDGGEATRETLRAYFATNRKVSSAAAKLRVNRQTVTNRLRAFERKVGRPLEECGAELETALRLELNLHSQSAGSQVSERFERRPTN